MELIAALLAEAQRTAAHGVSVFHFLRPAWLIALPCLWALAAWLARRSATAGAWSPHIDAALLQVLRLPDSGAAADVSQRAAGRDRSTPWRWLACAWTLAVLALAGPTWQREPAAGYAAPDSWVLVLDLSPSMNAPDAPTSTATTVTTTMPMAASAPTLQQGPDRSTRARYAIDNLLSGSKGARVALVVFSDAPYTVTPLTDDVATIRGLTGPLVPDILPTRGDRLAPALSVAQQLLERSASRGGQVVVITDGFADEAAALSAAELLRARKSTLHVLAIGSTAETSTARTAVSTTTSIAAPTGNAITATTALPTPPPPTDHAALQRLANAGGGRVFDATSVMALTADLHSRASRNSMTTISATTTNTINTATTEAAVPAERWRDAGGWLLPLVLLSAAGLARRGWWSD